MSKPMLLHDDLHHENILSAEREPWLAIDPKGVVSEAEYEVGAFLRNHLLLRPDPEKVLASRIAQFVESLGLNRERIIGWGLTQAALSGWWGYEDHGRVLDSRLFVPSYLRGFYSLGSSPAILQ